MRSLLVVLFALVTTASSAAAASYAVVYGYQPVPGGTWTVHGGHSFSSTGGTLLLARVATGEFEIKLGNMPAIGNVQARAHGSSNRCKVVQWAATGIDTIVKVRCLQPNGAPVDDLLVVQYYVASGPAAAETAYLWANQSTAGTYAAPAPYTYNSTGATNQISHGVGAGEYLAHLPGLTTRGGDPHVTAYGRDDAYCKVASWYQSPAGTFVAVRCFNGKGVPADTQWSLRYTHGHLADDDTRRGAYVLGNASFGPGTTLHGYTPDALWRYHTGGLAFTIDNERWAGVHFPLGIAPSSALVTAVGHDNSYCTTIGWTAYGTEIAMLAGCFRPLTGDEVGSAFTATMLTTTPR